MYNDLFSIGGLTVHGYGLCIGIGIAAALLLGGLLTTDLTGVPHGRLVLSVASVIIGHRKISFPAGQPMRSATHAITSR